MGTRQASTSERAWITALADPGEPLVFPWSGYDAIAPDWQFRDRVLDDHVLWLMTGGSITGVIDGRPVMLVPGSLLWMQPGVRHTFRRGDAPGAITLYFVRFRLGAAGAESCLADRTHQIVNDAWDVRGLVDDLVDELSTRLVYRDQRLRGLLLAICTDVLRSRALVAPSTSSGTLSRTHRALIEGHVRAHPSRRVTPADLARLVGLSPDYFARLFTRTFGVAPRVWLVDERLGRAARALIETTLNVSAIARHVGYNDVAAFSHLFKRRFGTSPQNYRKRDR